MTLQSVTDEAAAYGDERFSEGAASRNAEVEALTTDIAIAAGVVAGLSSDLDKANASLASVRAELAVALARIKELEDEYEPKSDQPWMGSSIPANQDQGGYTQWDYNRWYDFGTNGSDAIAVFNDHGVKGIGITEQSISPSTSVASVVAQVRALLEGFYEGFTSAAPAARKAVELHIALSNEYGDKITTANLPNWIAQHKAVADLLLEVGSNGKRRWPNASLWADPTHYQEQSRDKLAVSLAKSLHPIGQHLMRTGGGVAWSEYVPGRENTVDNPTFDKPSTDEADRYNLNKGYIIRCIMRTVDARTQGRADLGDPNAVMRFAVWEQGIGNDPNDRDHRPYFVVHSLIETNLILAERYDLPIAALSWWDQQLTKSGKLQSDNPFSHEPLGTTPSTADAWRFWRDLHPSYGGTRPPNWPAAPKATWPTGA